MIYALCFFLSGALVGLYMLLRHLKRRPLPKLAAVVHGLAGATGFAILLFTVMQMPGLAIARYALIIFIVAILLGVANLTFHIRGVRHRTILILAHGLVAVMGAGTLIFGIIHYALAAQNADATDRAVAGNGGNPSTTASSVETVAKVETAPKPSASQAPAPIASAEKSAAPFPAAPPSMHPGPAWTDRSITFVDDSAALSPAARVSLAEIAKDLQQHTDVRMVEVQGHADERGTDAHNLDLTRSRASAVVDALVASGVARSRLRSAGYGASCPADSDCQVTPAPASCHSQSSWQGSRRVVFLILEAGSERFHGKVACDRGAGLVPAEDRPYSGQ